MAESISSCTHRGRCERYMEPIGLVVYSTMMRIISDFIETDSCNMLLYPAVACLDNRAGARRMTVLHQVLHAYRLQVLLVRHHQLQHNATARVKSLSQSPKRDTLSARVWRATCRDTQAARHLTCNAMLWKLCCMLISMCCNCVETVRCLAGAGLFENSDARSCHAHYNAPSRKRWAFVKWLHMVDLTQYPGRAIPGLTERHVMRLKEVGTSSSSPTR